MTRRSKEWEWTCTEPGCPFHSGDEEEAREHEREMDHVVAHDDPWAGHD